MISKEDSNQRRYWPLAQMVACRMREFIREPEAVVWTYGFPILMTVALGIAFRNQPVTKVVVDVIDNSQAAATRRRWKWIRPLSRSSRQRW